MIKLLHLEITDTCESCPYYDTDWDFCLKIDKETRTMKYGIPEWCPLPEYEDGGKF